MSDINGTEVVIPVDGKKIHDAVARSLNYQPIVLSLAEARELYRYTRNDYINVNTYPALIRLLDRVSKAVADAERTS